MTRLLYLAHFHADKLGTPIMIKRLEQPRILCIATSALQTHSTSFMFPAQNSAQLHSTLFTKVEISYMKPKGSPLLQSCFQNTLQQSSSLSCGPYAALKHLQI